MPYANNNGVKIYYEVEGEGPPLLMHHGSGTLLESWRDLGYVKALENDYCLVLMDARGHGKSDKPHNPEAYTMEQRVGDVVAVLDHTGVDRTHFFGYSYGGRVGFELAKLAPQRVRSMIIGGFGARTWKTDAKMIQFWESGPKALEGLVAAIIQLGPISPGLKAGLLANDPQAILALLRFPWPDLEGDLSRMIIPFLIFAGEADDLFPDAQAAAKHLPDVTFVSFPGLDHLQAAFRSDLVLPHIKKFLAQVSKK